MRIGNDAYCHQQHDVWGTMLDSVYIHTKSGDRLNDRTWRILTRQVECALEHWREPDRGLWEVRGEPQHFTASKVMCWVAVDRGAKLARLRDEGVSGVNALAVLEAIGRGAERPSEIAGRLGTRQTNLSRLLQQLMDASMLTRELPYGKQRLLEIALALAGRPRVLLLDEPAAGVPSGESAQLLETIENLPGDVTIVLIEHDMSLVFRFAQRITVMVEGTILTEGTPREIAADERVRAVYLGQEAHRAVKSEGTP